MIIEHGVYEMDDGPGRVDREAVWDFLSTEAYWGKTRTRADFEKQFTTAWRVAGAYERTTGRLVGFARAMSDGAANAYLADVFVIREARASGLGKQLVETMIDEGPGADFRWMLHTADAHGLYKQYGFVPPGDTYMERQRRLSGCRSALSYFLRITLRNHFARRAAKTVRCLV